ncbi:GntR family transcriptional regulator [Antribacter gilvus]|uniref:GntR family transcriptional regulator n=1 Tax=Antribacter gilvus TaxID=2304675 RepID=UPI000F786877|nr:GntR family transcriptional regulator [Antribacter gilvus]
MSTSPDGKKTGAELLDEYRRRIRAGELEPGSRLPSASEFQELHGVSATVHRDVSKALKSDGLAIGQPGRAVIVAPRENWSAAPAGDSDLTERVAALEAAVQELAREVRSRS